MTVVEKYYSVHELHCLLMMSEKTIHRRLKAGAFGHKWVNVGTAARPSYRVPASDVKTYLEHNQTKAGEFGVAARTAEELKRKLKCPSQN